MMCFLPLLGWVRYVLGGWVCGRWNAVYILQNYRFFQGYIISRVKVHRGDLWNYSFQRRWCLIYNTQLLHLNIFILIRICAFCLKPQICSYNGYLKILSGYLREIQFPSPPAVQWVSSLTAQQSLSMPVLRPHSRPTESEGWGGGEGGTGIFKESSLVILLSSQG